MPRWENDVVTRGIEINNKPFMSPLKFVYRALQKAFCLLFLIQDSLINVNVSFSEMLSGIFSIVSLKRHTTFRLKIDTPIVSMLFEITPLVTWLQNVTFFLGNDIILIIWLRQIMIFWNDCLFWFRNFW